MNYITPEMSRKKKNYSSIDPSLESEEVLSEHTRKSCSATLNTNLT